MGNNKTRSTHRKFIFRLFVLGLYLLILLSHTPILSQAQTPFSYTTPITYTRMMEQLEHLEKVYPKLLQLDSIGTSVEGRDIPLVKLGTGKKEILLCGSHHAREYMSSTYLMKVLETACQAALTEKKADGWDVASLLKEVTVYVVPMVNPDGVTLVNEGVDAMQQPDVIRKMLWLQASSRKWKSNANGVDLNRQYPVHWADKTDPAKRPASEMYKGKKAATEPEVQAVMALCEAHDFLFAVSFHTKGNTIYWADRDSEKTVPGALALANRMASATGYGKQPVSKNPATYGGGFENWFRQQYKRPAYCVEMTPAQKTDTPWPDKDFEKLVWKRAKTLCWVLMDAAMKLH